jgi:hypothetical protein
VLTVRLGDLEDGDCVSTHTLPVRLGDGSQRNLRMTTAVMDALFGSPYAGTPERNAWEAARERRRQELGG